jgi:predicted ATPase
VLTQEQGHWQLADAIPDIQRELPESARSMIQRKIEQLGEAERRLLVAASVQGYEFDSAVLAKALAADSAEVEDQLETLERAHDFVRFVREHEFPDRTLSLRYRFVHVLYQNALHASLRATRRVSLSAEVAHALLAFYGEQRAAVASELALLFEAARDFAQAADFFLLAAQKAARVFAYQEAAGLARRGLELLHALPDTPERAQRELLLLTALGMALIATQGHGSEHAAQVHSRARELCRQLGESPQLFPVLAGLWGFHVARAEYGTARQLAEEMLRLATSTQVPAFILNAHQMLGFVLVLIGEISPAQGHFAKGMAVHEPQRNSGLFISNPVFPAGASRPGCCGFLDSPTRHFREAKRR